MRPIYVISVRRCLQTTHKTYDPNSRYSDKSSYGFKNNLPLKIKGVTMRAIFSNPAG